MPRFSLRRTILYLVGFATVALFVLNMHFRDQWLITNNGVDIDRVDSSQPHDTSSVFVDYLQTESALQVLRSDPFDSNPHDFQDVYDELLYGVGNNNNSPPGRFWFMKDGWIRPKPSSSQPRPHLHPLDGGQRYKLPRPPLWPHENQGDRIVEQLMFVPHDYTEQTANETRLKKIVLYNGIGNWSPMKPGREYFQKSRCPVDTCAVTAERSEVEGADAVLFRDHFSMPRVRRPSHQIWILYLLECPAHTQSFHSRKIFNWTATYRHDSDIVAPYEKFVSYDPRLKTKLPERNYAYNKTRKVAWFVSNCGARNGRLHYAQELARHIEVDIYGACGSKSCPRHQQNKCFSMLNTDYKFYLSFENSNCRDYITEKFFVNGLGHDVVPIVMGARKEDYERVAPKHSFISVEDFDSPKLLANYLHKLDANDTLYNEYFRWKGTGEFVNTNFWCRVCALLHDRGQVPKVYDDIEVWWRGPGTCSQTLWREHRRKDVASVTNNLTVK